MFRLFFTFLIFLPVALHAADARKDSGQPIPRFVSMKSSELNVRSGPGTRYPILWVYRREGMPVEVVEEFEYWRKIKDIEGTSGWVHKSMLDGRRNVMLKDKVQALRENPDDKADPVVRAEGSVIARLLECQPEWCRVKIGNNKGWLRKKQLWGVYEKEIIKK